MDDSRNTRQVAGVVDGAHASQHLRAAVASILVFFGVIVVISVSSCGNKTEARSGPSAKPARVAGTSNNTIAAVGDIACPANERATADLCAQTRVANRIKKLNPGVVLLLGDIQYPTGSLAEFQNSFGKSWGGLRRQWRPAIGNHEYITPEASGYFDFFGKRAGGSGGYYSYDVASWHVIALNSTCTQVSCALGSPQGKWLANDLAAHKSNECVAAYWHAPLFSSGSEHGNDPSVKPFWVQLLKAHADVIMNGHDHDYERFAPQDENANADPAGIREFVVGTGGRSHYEIGTRQPNSQAAIADKFGALSMQLGKTGYTWKFVATNGATLDRGKARCH